LERSSDVFEVEKDLIRFSCLPLRLQNFKWASVLDSGCAGDR